MDPDQPGPPRSLIRIHAVRLQTLLQVDKLVANNIEQHQTARRLHITYVHIHCEHHLSRQVFIAFLSQYLLFC
jgi:hypothetical protein